MRYPAPILVCCTSIFIHDQIVDGYAVHLLVIHNSQPILVSRYHPCFGWFYLHVYSCCVHWCPLLMIPGASLSQPQVTYSVPQLHSLVPQSRPIHFSLRCFFHGEKLSTTSHCPAQIWIGRLVRGPCWRRVLHLFRLRWTWPPWRLGQKWKNVYPWWTWVERQDWETNSNSNMHKNRQKGIKNRQVLTKLAMTIHSALRLWG